MLNKNFEVSYIILIVIKCTRNIHFCYSVPREYLSVSFNCLTRDSISVTHRNIVNVFIVYEIDTWSRDLNIDFIKSNCLFEAVKLTMNADPDKYG